jgi:aspartyl-tRNA(Asn)/glutamyl-tRNA(Gln) amidotransferase subunit C
MAKVSKQEVLKLARMSQLTIEEQEIPAFIKQLEDLLTYAERVKDLAFKAQGTTQQNVNIMRADMPQETNPQPILAQAPLSEENFFVVPMILDNE